MNLKKWDFVKILTEKDILGHPMGAQKRPGTPQNAKARPKIPPANVDQHPKIILHASAKTEKYFSCVVDE